VSYQSLSGRTRRCLTTPPPAPLRSSTGTKDLVDVHDLDLLLDRLLHKRDQVGVLNRLGDDALVAASIDHRLQLGVLRLRAVVRVKDDQLHPSAAAVV